MQIGWVMGGGVWLRASYGEGLWQRALRSLLNRTVSGAVAATAPPGGQYDRFSWALGAVRFLICSNYQGPKPKVVAHFPQI